MSLTVGILLAVGTFLVGLLIGATWATMLHDNREWRRLTKDD